MKHIKSETITKICQLSAGVIAAICAGALVGLVLLVNAGLLHWFKGLACVPLIMLIGVLDALWIDRHFVDGEWI